MSNSIATKWKKTAATPQGDTLDKIADYFGVTTDYLLGKKEALSFDDFTYALHNERGDLTEEDKALLLKMARQLSEKNKKG